MQIAEVLSDLTSLRVCDPSAALALVSASASSAARQQTPDATDAAKADGEKNDPDLQRAKDLLALHAVFKGDSNGGAGAGGLLAELRTLRERVGRAVGGDEEGFDAWE